MSLLRRFLRPPNALILAYDHLEQEAAEQLAAQIKEVRQYYEMVTLSRVTEALRQGKALGMAAVVFRHARKSLIVRGLSRTRDEGIPITVFVDAERVGTNRLPLDEELRIYATHYPGRIAQAELTRRLEQCWTAPAEVEAFLQSCRRGIGPFPLNDLDPTKYFATWGNLREIPPPLVEFGLAVTADPAAQPLAAAASFARQQIKQPVTLAASPLRLPETALLAAGFEAVLGSGKGAVEKSTSRWDLPQWEFTTN